MNQYDKEKFDADHCWGLKINLILIRGIRLDKVHL